MNEFRESMEYLGFSVFIILLTFAICYFSDIIRREIYVFRKMLGRNYPREVRVIERKRLRIRWLRLHELSEIREFNKIVKNYRS